MSGADQFVADAVIATVASAFGVEEAVVTGRSRTRQATDARHAAMYLCRQLTNLSFPAIARVFGNVDHTTVMGAVQRVENRLADDAYRSKLAALENDVSARLPGHAP